MRKFPIYAGRDKGEAVLIVAPDLENAQTMVDASTELIPVGSINVRQGYGLKVQGPINAETLLLMAQGTWELKT